MRRYCRILLTLTLSLLLLVCAVVPAGAVGVRTSAYEVASADWWPTFMQTDNILFTSDQNRTSVTHFTGNHTVLSTFVPVKPHTEYKMSARVRVEGYQAAGGKQSGVRIMDNIAGEAVKKSRFTTSSDWTDLEITFTTGSETFRNLSVEFGDTGAPCSGTMFFKNVILERTGGTPVRKPVSDSNWNVLYLIYVGVETPDFQNYFTQEGVDEIVWPATRLMMAVSNLSANRTWVGSGDVYFIDEPIRSLSGSYAREPVVAPDGDISLDQYLEGYDYQEVVIYLPVADTVEFINEEWLYLSEGEYVYQGQTIYYSLINTVMDGKEDPYEVYGDNYDGDLAVLLHCHLNNIAHNALNNGFAEKPDTDKGLENAESWGDWLKHDADLLRNPEAKGGLPQAAFEVDHYDPRSTLGIWRENFMDISEADQFYKDAQFACLNGLFNGVSPAHFDPEGNMTRAMFVTVMGRFAGVDVSKYTDISFSDVQPGQWYTPYVAWAESAGIVKGYENGTFGVNDPVTIEQAAVILQRYAAYLGVDTSAEPKSMNGFPDTASVSGWAADGMAFMVARSLYAGVNGWLGPQNYASRIQVARMLRSMAFTLD